MTLGLVVLAATSALGAPTAGALPSQEAPDAVLITPAIPERPVAEVGEVFFDQVFTIVSPDGNGVIASTPDGVGEVYVDDQLLVTVTRPDGSERTLLRGFEFQPPSPPIDLSELLDPGTNVVRIGLRDTVGSVLSSTALWLVGVTSGTSTEVRSPDVRIVRWFKPLQDVDGTTLDSCRRRLPGRNGTGAVAVCGFLLQTGNPPPPETMPTADWQAFLATKEYRGALGLPDYRVVCDANGNVAQTQALGEPSLNLGYTPNPGPRNPALYTPASPYGLDPAYSSGIPQVTTSPAGTSVHISLKLASRIADHERLYSWSVTGFDAPYIWTVLHMKVSCDGHTSATITYSDFPSIVAYADGDRLLDDEQTPDFIRFLKGGGRLPSLPGQGRFSPVCQIYVFPGSETDRIPRNPNKQTCERGRLDGFLPLT